MNLTTLEGLVWTKLNDGGGVYYPDAVGALSEAQRLFVLLSLCLEKTEPFALTAGQLAYNVLGTLGDLIVPRRIYNSLGAQLRPVTIAQLEAMDSGWQNTPGTPTRYVWRGLDWLAVYPQPVSADSLTIVYACSPAPLTEGAVVPQIRPASQYAMVNFAAWALRQPEGGQEFTKFGGLLPEFLAEAAKVAALVAARNQDAGLETAGPFELERVK